MKYKNLRLRNFCEVTVDFRDFSIGGHAPKIKPSVSGCYGGICSPSRAGYNEVLLDPLRLAVYAIFGVKVKPISGSTAEIVNLSAVKMVSSREVT